MEEEVKNELVRRVEQNIIRRAAAWFLISAAGIVAVMIAGGIQYGMLVQQTGQLSASQIDHVQLGAHPLQAQAQARNDILHDLFAQDDEEARESIDELERRVTALERNL